MKISELKAALSDNPDLNIRFCLPDGSWIPAHAHVTEVARIDKRFIDCGGTFRSESYCRLQSWVADDTWHRLPAKKLLAILDKSASVIGNDDLDLDLEHQLTHITQFPLSSFDTKEGELIIKLDNRHTACLAPEKCLPKEQLISIVS